MSETKDEHGEMTAEHVIDCDNLKVPIKTNEKLDSYVKVTVKCDVKCSLAQQNTYARLMEPAQKDEFGYGVGNMTLLDDYASRAKRIAATYARFCLETEDGGDPRVQGRHYWMGFGAFASKTVACMFNTTQLHLTTMDLGILPLQSGYEGLAKGNFWLFQDIGSWHFLYNMCNTTADDGKAYESSFVKCRDMKSVNTLCPTVKDIMQNKLPWAEKSLPLIGNLEKTVGRPLPEALEKGMAFTHDIEMAILANKDEEDIRIIQMKHILEIADHEQGNVLQPLIYEDPDTYTIDFQDMAVLMRWIPLMPEVKLTFTSECDESEAKVENMKNLRKQKERQEEAVKNEVYTESLRKERERIRFDILKEEGLFMMSNEKLSRKIEAKMEEDGIYGKLNPQEKKEEDPELKDIVSKPEDGQNLELESWEKRMQWIRDTGQKYHDLWGSDPLYMRSELAIISGWVNEQDQTPTFWHINDEER